MEGEDELIRDLLLIFYWVIRLYFTINMISLAELKKVNRTLIKKTIKEIKSGPINEREGWYFVGVILTFP